MTAVPGLGPPETFRPGDPVSAAALNRLSGRVDLAASLASLVAVEGSLVASGPAGQRVRPAPAVPRAEIGRVVEVLPGSDDAGFDAIEYRAAFASLGELEIVAADRRFHPARVALAVDGGGGGGVQLFRPAPIGSPVFAYRVPCVAGGPCADAEVFEVFFYVPFEAPVARVCRVEG